MYKYFRVANTRVTRSQMDKETLFAGGVVSMLGMEAASYAGELLKQRRMRDDERPIVGTAPGPDDDDTNIPYTVDDNKGSILCFQDSVCYVSNSLLTVTLLDNKKDDDQRYFHLQPHYAVMFNKACRMKHRFDRFRSQCGIWLLHMLLSDLNTLLLLSPRKPLKSMASKFIPVIRNMTGSRAIPTHTWRWWRHTATAASATESRKDAMGLVIDLQDAISDLAAAIRDSTIPKSMFFYCYNGSGETIVYSSSQGTIETAAHTVCGRCNIAIVTTHDSGGDRLRYTVV